MAFFQSLNSSVSYDDFIDAVSAGSYSPSYKGISALKNSDVLTAVSIIAGDVSRFPIIKKDEDGNIVHDTDVNYLLNVRSTGNATARAWKFAMTVNAILSGNSFSRIIRDPTTKKPMQFEFYRPSETILEQEDDSGNLIYTFTNTRNSKQYICPAEDVIHWKFFTHDTLLGRSPLLSLGEEIGLQESGVETLTRFFKSGFSSGILKLKGANLNKEARKRAREDFDFMRLNAVGGSPLVFDDTQEYTPLEIDTNVLQLINSNNYSTSQIAKCLRVPAYKLAVNSPNQSIKQLNEDYIANDLPYYLDAITSEHTLKNFSDADRKKYHLEFDTRAITGRDVDEVSKLVDKGLISPNEGRIELGKKESPDKNMDRIQSSLNYVFLDKKEEYQDMKRNKKMKKGDNKNAKEGTQQD